MDKFRNRYRIPSARAPWWNYSADAAYFITICTANRQPFFGQIITGSDGIPVMNLSPLGKIALECWLQIPEHFPFVILDAFVVMPDHVHGILVFNKTGLTDGDNGNNVEAQYFAPLPGATTGGDDTEAQNVAPLRGGTMPRDNASSSNKFGSQSQNLASVVRGYKTGVTVCARKLDPTFGWQSRFYDHIIRDEHSWRRIAAYICENPLKWETGDPMPGDPEDR